MGVFKYILLSSVRSLASFSFAPRFYKPWANHIIRDVFVAVSAMSVWMASHSPWMWTIKSTALMTTTPCSLRNAQAVAKVISKKCNREWSVLLIERCFFLCLSRCSMRLPGIRPVEGTEETVRVVSMDKDFHVDCYVCEECGMQLTDEPESKCYPFEGHLMCKSCHLHRISMSPMHSQNEPVCATYQYHMG